MADLDPNSRAARQLRALAQDFLDYHEWDETDDGSADTGAENEAMNNAGKSLMDLLDELTNAPRCANCHQFITERGDGSLVSRVDLVPGLCMQGLFHLKKGTKHEKR